MEEVEKPKCNYECGGWYANYQDPTGTYKDGMEEILVDARTDMFIKRLISYSECMKKQYQELALIAAAPKNV